MISMHEGGAWDVNRDSQIASSSTPQSHFFEKVRCLILAFSQSEEGSGHRAYIEFIKFDVTIKKIQIRLKFEDLD